MYLGLTTDRTDAQVIAVACAQQAMGCWRLQRQWLEVIMLGV